MSAPVEYTLTEVRSLIMFAEKAIPAAGYSAKQTVHQKSCSITFSWTTKRDVIEEGMAFARWATDAPITLLQVCQQLEALLAAQQDVQS